MDDMYIMVIRRANLDAMAGRAETTLIAHSNSILRTVKFCQAFNKTPSIPPRGPMPFEDQTGMGVACEMLYYSLVAKGRINPWITFDTTRKPRGTFSKCWESSPQGISEAESFGTGMGKYSLTSCPTQSDWFASHFMAGLETRMGYVTEANKALHVKVVVKMLELIKVEVTTQTPRVANEMWKVGAAMAVAQMGSLRGPEVFMLDLAGIRAHIARGRNGVLPEGNPLEVGQCLLSAPHVYLALIANFKGETGVREHLVALASESKSGIKLRWWLEKLIEIRKAEGHTLGPAFGKPDGVLARMSDYDDVLHYFLRQLQMDSK